MSDLNNGRIEEFSTAGAYIAQIGSKGAGNGQLSYPAGIGVDAAGNLYVADSGNNRIEEFTPAGVFIGTFGSTGSGNGQFDQPGDVAVSASGELYITDSENNRMQTWHVAPRPGNDGAHDTRTAYYTAGEESEAVVCRKHPEWADLPCQTEPAAQVVVSGLPELPVTTIASYNIWDEAETTEEKFGTGAKAVTRTKAQTYDPAGRALTSEEKASPVTDTALPKVTNEYNASTGALEKQSTTEGTITSKDNTLGQLVESSDASGNVAKYVYEEGGDGRLLEESEGKGEEAKSSQAYIYNATHRLHGKAERLGCRHIHGLL